MYTLREPLPTEMLTRSHPGGLRHDTKEPNRYCLHTILCRICMKARQYGREGGGGLSLMTLCSYKHTQFSLEMSLDMNITLRHVWCEQAYIVTYGSCDVCTYNIDAL